MIDKKLKKEEKASKHINILTHYADDTLIDKGSKLIKIIKLSGLDFSTKDNQLLDGYKRRRNNLLKSFSSEFAFYCWEIKRKSNLNMDGDFSNVFANAVNIKYKNMLQNSSMFHTEHYLAVMTKQPEGLLNKCFSIFNWLNLSFDKKAKTDYLAKRHQELNDAVLRIMHALSDYDTQLLRVYEKNNELFSAPLAFLSELINFEECSVPLQINDAASILPRKRLFFNRKSGTIEMRSANNQSKYAAILSIKAYTPTTYQNMLSKLTCLCCEYVLTQSYRFYDKQTAKQRMLDQQQEMLQSEEESYSLTEEIDEAFDDAASGDVGYGKHHFTLTCYANNIQELNNYIGEITSLFSDVDITVVREDIACELGFWAQFPGNFSYVCRPADISTENIASFASFPIYPSGKANNNWWGEVLTIFQTQACTPYYFNFHYKDVGNFLVYGAMGAGKTVLIGFLILQSMKFGGKRIIFDKDRGLEIMVRAMGGMYEGIKPGIKTGFNPCHLPDTVENRTFLLALIKKMLTINSASLTDADINIIENAIDGLYQLPDFFSRQFCHMASYFGAKKQGSLRARFDEWHSDGQFAWLFDNENDSLDLYADVIGFDLGHLLKEAECKTPALMYLLYRVEQALENERGILFCDEGWLYLDDEYFKTSINDWSRTPRKKNNIFGLATQAANDTIHSAISKTINESACSKIFFPNASADRKIHIDDLGLTESEYNLVKTLADDQHYFLFVHGRGLNKESVVLTVNLQGLEDEIAIISAREETLTIMDQVIAEVGNDPNKWLSLFHERRKGMAT